MHVMVVERAGDSAEALCALLSASGHEAELATTGARALELAAARRPDVVVLALDLPDMPGEAVATALKAHPDAPYAIAFSGFPERAPDALAAGCDRFVLKPHFDRVVAALESFALRDRHGKVK